MNLPPWLRNRPARQGQFGTIVEARDGQPPGFIVSCTEPGCTFASDAHGATEAEALASIQPLHASFHTLVARAVDYTNHPLYR